MKTTRANAVVVVLLLAGAAAAQHAEPADPFSAFDDFDDFDEDSGGLIWSGFVEAGAGRRIDRDDRFPGRQTLGDLRLRLETDWENDSMRVTIRGDAIYDDYADDSKVEMRDLNLQASVGAVDLKIGRQVLTWGTGDLLFLNDLFPKSWVSFFSGREDEYLKAPSDAVRITRYAESINADIVWSPQFEPDDYLTGERFSFFSPFAGNVIAPRPPLSAPQPGGGIDNGELAIRLFKTIGSTEYAGYLYRGFFKRPLGLDATLQPRFPRLAAYGASLRRPLAGGLLNVEVAYHDSREDSSGTDPLVPNDQLRTLIGYEFEAAPRFNVGLQYYLEWTRDYADLIANSSAPQFEPDERRNVLTGRLTYRTDQDRITVSLFVFYSPSDNDHYLRPVFSLRQSDRWSFAAGANLFSGESSHTFFGQLEDNSNAYVRARFSF